MLLSALLLAIAPRTIIFIVLVLVLFFGAKRIPELMRGMGQGIREFKDASKEPQPEYRDQQQANQQPNGYPNQYPQQGYQQPNTPAGNPNQRQA